MCASISFHKIPINLERFSLLVYLRVPCGNRRLSERIENENELLLAIQSTIDREEMITEGRRVIKIAVIIPFPIYRPNKIMRIDAVSVEYRRTRVFTFY